ncbi:MAG: hypothetical protein ABIB71_07265 [Candidatus Woesearchaeota archaeon]
MVDWEAVKGLAALGVLVGIAGGFGYFIYFVVDDVRTGGRARRVSEYAYYNNKRFHGLKEGLESLALSYLKASEDDFDKENLSKRVTETADLYLKLREEGLKEGLEDFALIASMLGDATGNEDSYNTISTGTNLVAAQLLDYNVGQISFLMEQLDNIYDSDEDNSGEFTSAVSLTLQKCTEANCDIQDTVKTLEDISLNPNNYRHTISEEFFEKDKMLWMFVKKDENREDKVEIKDNLSASKHELLLPYIIKPKLPEAPKGASQAAEKSYSPIALEQYIRDRNTFEGQDVEISAFPVSQVMSDNSDSYALKLIEDNYYLNCMDKGITDDNLLIYNDVQQVIKENEQTIDRQKVTVYGQIKQGKLMLDAVEAYGIRRDL